jgi:hypothetical protein
MGLPAWQRPEPGVMVRQGAEGFWARSSSYCVLVLPGFGLAHRRTVQFDTVGVVDEAVENGIGEGWFADHVVPRVEVIDSAVGYGL